MEKIIILLVGLLFAVQANAEGFYTTYEQDFAKVKQVIYSKNAPKDKKEQAIKEVAPVIKKIRAKAFSNIVFHCKDEVAKLCKNAKTDEDKAKCLSNKPLMLSEKCLTGIKKTYRKR